MTDGRSVCYTCDMKAKMKKALSDESVQSTDRKRAIQQVAEKLFLTKGYESTSVNTIVEKANVAKGTFYHHFKSKEDILSAIVDELLDTMVAFANSVAEDDSLTAIEKLETIFSTENSNNKKAVAMKEGLHHAKNREFHEKVNVQLVLRFSPIITKIVEQGVEEKEFKVANILETVQFLLTASQFLFDEGLFKWSSEEWRARRSVMQTFFESSLGAKKGSFSFIRTRF